MKKIILAVSAFALAIPVPHVMPAPAQSQGRSWAQEFCKQDVPLNPPSVLGDCVGFVNTFVSESEGVIRFACDYLEMLQPALFYAHYDSFDECIVDRASRLPPPPY